MTLPNEPRVGQRVRAWLGSDFIREGEVIEVDTQSKFALVQSEYGRVHQDWVRWSDLS